MKLKKRHVEDVGVNARNGMTVVYSISTGQILASYDYPVSLKTILKDVTS